MKKMIFVAIVIIIIGSILLGVRFYMKNIHTPENILRVARKESELTEGNYILGQPYRTTGFDWLLIQNENGEKVQELINITGADPFTELNLSYEFGMGRNTFIFYVEERIEGFSEEMGVSTVEYVVTGWDILYPVRRVTFFSPRRYIIETDMRDGGNKAIE